VGRAIQLDGHVASAGRATSRDVAPLRLALAPSSGDGDVVNVLRARLATVAGWRMDDARFAFDSSFVVPEAREELAVLRALVRDNPGCPLAVFGHADPVGDDDYNRHLSERRAEAIYGLLLRDVARWQKLHDAPFGGDRWGRAQDEMMLRALGLPTESAVDGATRKDLFGRYMDLLCNGDAADDTLALTQDDFLGGDGDPSGKVSFQGCGKFNPVLVFSKKETEALDGKPHLHAYRDQENAVNRRVTVFLFEKGSRATAKDWPCPRASEAASRCTRRFWNGGDARRKPGDLRRSYEDTGDTMACRFYERFVLESPCEAAGETLTFVVRVCDATNTPIAHAPCRIHQPGVELKVGEADADGWLIVNALRAPRTCLLTWTTPEGKDALEYPFSQEVFVDVRSGDAPRLRLHNLGYAVFDDLAANVEAFQAEFGLPVTGDLADIADALEDWHDGGDPPGKGA
jgi:outer membrane protein OmpA-like peptidoglycan-associated protein